MALVDVDTVAAYSGEPAAQADWLGPKVDGCLVLFCNHQMIEMNRVNSWKWLTPRLLLLITVYIYLLAELR